MRGYLNFQRSLANLARATLEPTVVYQGVSYQLDIFCHAVLNCQGGYTLHDNMRPLSTHCRRLLRVLSQCFMAVDYFYPHEISSFFHENTSCFIDLALTYTVTVRSLRSLEP
jgi:hypothetical protein